MKKEFPYLTTYSVAVNWLDGNLILLNDIVEIDDMIFENLRFDLFDEKGNETDIFQWFITDFSSEDVEFLEEHFGLLFAYSDKLDLYVLCVPHLGTSWTYVPCGTDIENAACEMGTRFVTKRELKKDY